MIRKLAKEFVEPVDSNNLSISDFSQPRESSFRTSSDEVETVDSEPAKKRGRRLRIKYKRVRCDSQMYKKSTRKRRKFDIKDFFDVEAKCMNTTEDRSITQTDSSHLGGFVVSYNEFDENNQYI